ncbi:MAG: hypothetical protein HC913_20115 [Microscillaceae bacterium]|nr:hypothetical protein [Microscillaceae bacterium]
MMKKLSVLFVLSILGGLPGYAQSDTLSQEFERFWQEQNQAFLQYEEEQNTAFLKFKRALDQAFAQALRQDWTAYRPEKAPPSPETPKPRQSPSAPPVRPLPQELPTLPPADIQPPPLLPPPPQVLQLPKPAKPVLTSAFSFLENEIRLPDVASFAIPWQDTPSEKAIGDFWEAMSQKPYPVLLQALWQHKEDFQLSDWHFYQLLQKPRKTSIRPSPMRKCFLPGLCSCNLATKPG